MTIIARGFCTRGFRTVTLALGVSLLAACATSPATTSAAAISGIRILPAQISWAPPPAQAPATEGIAALPGGAKLWYTDTGGKGEAVILLHPASGNATSWAYQQPVLAQAGFRVITYSRRGYYKSEAPSPGNPGTAAGDLNELADYLGLGKFHLVATAAGSFVALDYAIHHQDRLLSLVYSNSLGQIQDPAYNKMLGYLLDPAFSKLSVDFRELGPSYRASYRPGVEQWLHIHEMTGSMGTPQGRLGAVTWAGIESLKLPTLLLTSDSDFYMPVSSLREFRRHLPHSDAAVFSEAGHAAYWEQYEAFNAELLRFLRKVRGSSR